MKAEPPRVEDRLRRELDRALPKIGFDPLIHRQYRASMRAEHRLLRMLYYLLPAVLFGTLSLYENGRFSGPIDLSSTVGQLIFGLLVPVLLLAAVANSYRAFDSLSSWINFVACLLLWSGILLARYEAPNGVLWLPREVLGLTLLGGAVLCGFRLFPLLCGIAIFTALNLLIEIWGKAHSGRFPADALLIAVLGGCAAAAACSAEASRRRLWIAAQIAEFASRSDPLTGLLTRAEFNLRFPLVVAQGRREQEPVSIMLFLIDDFRIINETFDHLYGDMLLRRVAEQTLNLANRPLDLKARFAGGKLVIAMYNADADAAAAVANKLMLAVRSIEWEPPTEGAPPQVTLSAGLISMIPAQRTTVLELLAAAETMMERARRAGRDSMVASNPLESSEDHS
jgi:diguanylate cyclase (GGDEF)-like protein